MIDKIITIISKILNVPSADITPETEIGEPAEWDSMRNVMIFDEIEKQFSVKIDQSSLVDLETVQDIADLVNSLK